MSTITTNNLRKTFPAIYRALLDRGVLGKGSIIFTRDVRYHPSGEVLSEPYIILTKSNKIFEIKECGFYNYLELLGDEKVGAVLRRISHRNGKIRRIQANKMGAKHETIMAA